MTVRLHIDRLVVDGLPLTPRDRVALREAVQSELSALLTGPGAAWPRADVRVRRVQADAVAGRSVPVLGAQIAGAVHGGVRQVTGR